MRTTLVIVALMVCSVVEAQSKKETIAKEYMFEKTGEQNALIVANINGGITIEGYDGDIVIATIEKVITAKTDERLQRGLQEINLGVIDRADTIILFVQGGCPHFGRNKKGRSFPGQYWGYNWDNCDDKEKLYDYAVNFHIRVPKRIHLAISTINDGNVNVSNVQGKVDANNINGAITLHGLAQAARAHTINGDVTVNYIRNPQGDCRFYTLNGNIIANFRKQLSSNVAFKSYNGEFFTNIEQITSLPVQVDKKSGEKGTRYLVSGNRYKTGNGGALLDFETFNGNVYLKEQ